MITLPFRHLPHMLLTAAILVNLGLPSSRLRAADDEVGRRVTEHLQAGEFGPAQVLARSLPDPGRRDALLREIGEQQAAAGARRGSLRTLAAIRDDRIRTAAVRTLAESPGERGTPAGGGRGGVSEADFQALIDLITSTVSPDSWEVNGGNGAIEPFVSGVYVDPAGVLRRLESPTDQRLDAMRRRAALGGPNRLVSRPSKLRCVSLNRLEKAIQLRGLAGEGPDEVMRYLAGIYRVQYVFLFPDSGDLVLAGPASGWQRSASGLCVSETSGAPVLQLDDLVVLLRQARDGSAAFGCSINPRQESLARTQTFLQDSAGRKLRPAQREAWLEQLRTTVGRQDIEVFGVDPQTHVARVLVEADHHMKLIGIGLAAGPLGVPSYLDLVAEEGRVPESLSVLRWWFAMHYEAVRANADRTAYEWLGPAVRVLSENEHLSERGVRAPTGSADEKTQRFADSFTRHFEAVAAKYPVYAELRNVFDLALVATLIESERGADRVGWHATHFGDEHLYPVAVVSAAREVESVVNHRFLNGRDFVAVVSGGVHAQPVRWTSPASIVADAAGGLDQSRGYAAPRAAPDSDERWWWDEGN